MEQHIEAAKQAGNSVAAGITLGTLFGWLPHVAALLAVIWYLVLLYDRFIGGKRGGGSTTPLLIVAIAWALSPLPSWAHVEGHPEFDAWFNEQRVPDGRNWGGRQDYCCDKSDAYFIDEDTELRSVDGDPEVLIDGVWYRFPNRGVGNPGNTVMGATDNPTERMVAWVYNGNPRCLASRSGT